jgi:uncharacterized protein YdeI (YjbR/CyaY-like superfamily)
MIPIFFASPSEFRAWLEKHHKLEKEILVGYYKKESSRQNMTWSQSVDQALCFGWIDGVRRSIDAASYCIRFTPRRKTSIWSAINIKKVVELTRLGLIQPAGLEAFGYRTAEKSALYSFEQEDADVLPESFICEFKADDRAWAFFSKQAPSYRKAIIRWIVSAKQEATRLSRLGKAIEASGLEKRLGDQYQPKTGAPGKGLR